MPVLAGSLSRLFNMSMSLGIFPDDWKIARVAPIYKDGSEGTLLLTLRCQHIRE